MDKDLAISRLKFALRECCKEIHSLELRMDSHYKIFDGTIAINNARRILHELDCLFGVEAPPCSHEEFTHVH